MKYKGIIRKLYINNKSNTDKYIILTIELDNTNSNIEYISNLMPDKYIELDIKECNE